jgi:hypothetical protein
VFDQDCLHRAGRSCAQDLLAHRIVRIWVVPERFLAIELEDGGSEKDALRVSQALIQINDYSHRIIPLAFTEQSRRADRSRWRCEQVRLPLTGGTAHEPVEILTPMLGH